MIKIIWFELEDIFWKMVLIKFSYRSNFIRKANHRNGDFNLTSLGINYENYARCFLNAYIKFWVVFSDIYFIIRFLYIYRVKSWSLAYVWGGHYYETNLAFVGIHL